MKHNIDERAAEEAKDTNMATTSDSSHSDQRLRVICAGLGRTGTLSLKEALTVLGYKPYHFVGASHAKQWSKLAAGETSVDSVIDLIVQDGYDAVLENPCCDIYQDILRRYPDAKIILTVRDTPEKFEASWKVLFDTMIVTELPFSLKFPSFFGWIPLFQYLKRIRYMMGTTHLKLEPGLLTHGWRNKEPGWLAKQYELHNAHVRQHVPSDKLLVFNVKDGWKPLCAFLGESVPEDEPFPHSRQNDTKALLELKRVFETVVYSWIPVSVSLVVGVVLCGRHRFYPSSR